MHSSETRELNPTEPRDMNLVYTLYRVGQPTAQCASRKDMNPTESGAMNPANSRVANPTQTRDMNLTKKMPLKIGI